MKNAAAMDIRRDLARNTLAIVCIVGLIGLSVWVLRPFLAATVWAAMVVVATWPAFGALEARLGGRRSRAIGVMVVAMLCLLVLPLWLAVDTLVEHAAQLTQAGRGLAENGLPAPPSWVAQLPLIGERLSGAWGQLAASGPDGVIGQLGPHAAEAGKWLLGQVGGLSGMLIHVVLVVAIAAYLYGVGEHAARLAMRLGHRLAGERGMHSVVLAGQAIRAVALGVGVTALVQTLLGGIGLALAGIPFAALLTALMLMLCIAQVGPLVVLLPAAGWLFWSGSSGMAVGLVVWSLIVGTLDNFLRPALIRRGADLPLLLIFAGVIGGMLGFGLIGLFVGPVVLAVTYRLMLAWLDDVPEAPALAASQVDAAEPAPRQGG